MRTLPAIAAITVLSTSCSGSEGPGTAPDHRLDAQIWMVSGADQWSYLGEPLAHPFVAQVRDGAYGPGIPGVRVEWTITTGSGTIVPGIVTVTGADGQTMVTFTPSSPEATVRAAIEGKPASSVLFRTLAAPAGVVAVYGRPLPTPTGTSESIVFYEGNRFGVRYNFGLEYQGSYARNGAVLSLAFKEPSWAASATVRADSLTVTYNANASMSDFEDGTFILTQGVPPTS